jgi:hypothetical protein
MDTLFVRAVVRFMVNRRVKPPKLAFSHINFFVIGPKPTTFLTASYYEVVAVT